MSDPGLRGLRTCALAVPIAALLAAFGLGATSSGAQPSGTYCDAAYCYVQTCERLPPNCRYVMERVCHPIVKQECTTQNVRKCNNVPEQLCAPHTANECRSVRRWVCPKANSPPPAKIGSADDALPGEGQTEGSQLVADTRRKRNVHRRRPYHPYRQPSPQPQVQQQRPYHPYRPPAQVAQQNPNNANRPAGQCYWRVQHVCTPVTKQECRSLSKEVCNYQPEQKCHNRQAQDCRDERRQVCEAGQLKCRQQQAKRACPAPQYWTPQGCVSAPQPGYASPPQPSRAPPPQPSYAPPPQPSYSPPPTEISQQPAKGSGGKPPAKYVAPDSQKRPDIAKLDPLPDELPKTPDPPPPRKVEAPPPPTPPELRSESRAPAGPDPRGTTLDVNLNGRTWRIALDPVPIATGAGLALLVALLALWPKRKDVPTDADLLARLGIECRAEPDLGEQGVAHLERPPVGPRITVRATPGSRRHGIVMH